jgi:hypothetical protein
VKNPSVSFRSSVAAALVAIAFAVPALPALAAQTPVERVMTVTSHSDAPASAARTHATIVDGYAAYHGVTAARRMARRPRPRPTGELASAQSVLAGLEATYRYTDGVTVRFGTITGGYDAISYVTKGEILINSKHTMNLQFLVTHEIWHIIDWRDNGRMDWGESVPPRTYASYRR